MDGFFTDASGEVESWPSMADVAVTPARRSASALREPASFRFVALDVADQAAGWLMLTIHWTPNWSTHMPNSSPHICFSRGTVTVPPSDSCSQ